jgi:hypothetical protein
LFPGEIHVAGKIIIWVGKIPTLVGLIPHWFSFQTSPNWIQLDEDGRNVRAETSTYSC